MNDKFYFKPARGEQIETTIHMDGEAKSCIHGVVLDQSEKALQGALVLLFRAGETVRDARPIAQSRTDEDGHFVFGDLDGEVLYLIKIFQNNTRIRILEIIGE